MAAPAAGRTGLTLFRIAGIRITLDFSWFVVFTLVLVALAVGYFPRNFPGHDTQAYWLAGLAATLLFFTSVLLHELTHSLVAKRNGLEIPEITLFIFGGVAKMGEEPKDPRVELKVAIVGPLCSFALAAFFGLAKGVLAGFASALTVAVAGYLAWINLALGFFNLIPGFPLDGGRVLRAILWWRTGSQTYATKVASDIGKGFAVALMLLGALQIFAGALINGLWLLFIGMFLRSMSAHGYEELVIRKALESVPLREVMVREVVQVPPDLPISQLVQDYILRYGYRGFPVAEDGRIVGVVSLNEVREVPRPRQDEVRVRDIMLPLSEDLIIDPEATLAQALARMLKSGEERLLVMADGRLTGLITKTGLLRFVQIKQVLGEAAA
ncbi:MAG: site-2 protease family protein [Syntrophobacterales bacterium]|nr:site-2 protease family protein [Syntrophobacterales bacterium]